MQEWELLTKIYLYSVHVLTYIAEKLSNSIMTVSEFELPTFDEYFDCFSRQSPKRKNPNTHMCEKIRENAWLTYLRELMNRDPRLMIQRLGNVFLAPNCVLLQALRLNHWGWLEDHLQHFMNF